MRRLLVVLGLTAAADAHAICRVVTETGSPPPTVVPAQSVLLVYRRQVPLGGTCPADAGPPDGGDAGADCVPVRFADVTTMIVEPKFSAGAGGSRFAFLMVTPHYPTLSLYPRGVFTQLAAATAPQPHVVTVTIEDPSLGYKCNDPKWNSGGCGGGSWDYTPTLPNPTPAPEERPDGGLPTEPRLLGGYEVAVLDVEDVATLQQWLDDHHYQHDDADLAAVGGYIGRGWSVVAVRVAADDGFVGALEPLAFTWEGDELAIPMSISAQPGVGVGVPVTAYVAADRRFDFTGGVVRYAQPVSAIAGTTYLTRTDLWVELGTPAPDPVAVASPMPVPVRETYEVRREVRVPSSQCPRAASDARDPPGCSCRLGARERPLPALALLVIAAALALRSRRRYGQKR